MAAGSAILAIKIIADAKDATKEFEKTGSSLDKLGGTMTSMAVPALAVVGAFGAMAVAAAEDEAEADKLTAAIAAAGAATATSTAQVEEAIKAGQAKAFSDSEVRAGLQDLVTATGSVETATAAMAQAQDIARLAGVSLEVASAAVAKSLTGQDGPLRKLIPGLEKGATATETLANATALAAGQADAYAASAPGQMAIVADSFGELGEEVGSAFLPLLKELMVIVRGVTTLITENSEVVKALAVVIGVVAGAILAANIAMKAFVVIQNAIKIATTAWTVAQAALNVVLNLNPIGIVIIAITALVAAFILAYKNSETFRNIVDGVFKAVVGFVKTAVSTISTVIGTLTAILQAPFKALEGVVRTIMSTITNLVQSAVGVIEGILDGIRGAIDTVAGAVDAINPFAVAPPVPAGGGPAVAGLGRRSSRIGGGTYVGGPPNMVVQVTSADPEQVMRAIRRWSRANGGSGPFTRGLDRSTA